MLHKNYQKAFAQDSLHFSMKIKNPNNTTFPKVEQKQMRIFKEDEIFKSEKFSFQDVSNQMIE